MRHCLTTGILIVAACLTCACADPAANKPKASVGSAETKTTASRPSGAEALIISPENSKVEFVGAKVTRSHNGSFKQFDGVLDLVANNVEDSRVTIDIDTSSITTDEDQLTAHLKTADFFDVAKYPRATFVSTRIEPATNGGTHVLSGNLDLHGVRKSITFPATIEVTPESVSVKAEFAINRKDFGILYPGKADDLIRDGVVIKLTLNVPRAKQ